MFLGVNIDDNGVLTHYRMRPVKQTYNWFPARGWFSFFGTIYIHPKLYKCLMGYDLALQSEVIKTLAHEYKHIVDYRNIQQKHADKFKGIFNLSARKAIAKYTATVEFLFKCLPVYTKCKLEIDANNFGFDEQVRYMIKYKDKQHLMHWLDSVY